MQICILPQTDNHASIPPLSFYRPDDLPAAQPTVSKHWMVFIESVLLCSTLKIFPGCKQAIVTAEQCCTWVENSNNAFCRLPLWLSGMPAIDALRQGLVDLQSACEHISTTFQVCTCFLIHELCSSLFYFDFFFCVNIFTFAPEAWCLLSYNFALNSVVNMKLILLWYSHSHPSMLVCCCINIFHEYQTSAFEKLELI